MAVRVCVGVVLTLALALAGTPSAATPAWVQGTSGSTSGRSLSKAFTRSVQAGDLLVGLFRGAGGPSSVRDSLNGGWTKAVAASDGLNSIWFRPDSKAGADTTTVSGSSSGRLRLVAEEYSGIATSGALDLGV
jgi:hypothetical protein